MFVSANCTFFKVCLGCTFPYNVSVVNIGMYVRMIQLQKQMFIYIVVRLIQQPNIFSNFTFNISNVLFPACFHLVILLGILNILIILFHHYLYLILVKEAEYRSFCLVCEKTSTLFCLHLMTVYLK